MGVSVLTPILSLGLLSLSWAFAVYSHGAVEPVDGRYSAIAISLSALILWSFSRGQRSAGKSRRLDVILLGAALAITGLQLVPLPMSVVRTVSPHRAAQLTDSAPILGPIPAASLSSVPAAGPDALLILASYILVFLLIRDLRTRFNESPWALLVPVIVVASLEATLGVLQFYGGADNAVGTYVNRNHFAGLLEMSLPLAVMYGYSLVRGQRGRFQLSATPGMLAFGSFCLAALMFVSVIHSHSRMGFIASLSGLFAIGALGVQHREPAEGRARRIWLPLLGLGAAVVIAFVFLSPDQLITRIAAMTNVQDMNSDTRKQLWKETLPLIKDYAAAGCGIGGYESCFLPYKTVAPERTADYAHNDYLQVMAELGLPAFLCLFAVVIMAYWNAFRQSGRSDSGRYLAIACVGSLTAILLHSLVDFNMYIPANGMLAAWLAGAAREA
jgi:O-antigen ligase